MASPILSAFDVFDHASVAYEWRWTIVDGLEGSYLRFHDGWKEYIYPLRGTLWSDPLEAVEIVTFVKGEFTRMWKEGAIRR